MSPRIAAADRMCQFCGDPAQQLHHLTGRDPSGAHLDPALVVALCRNHHVLVHSDLRSQQLDTPDAADWNDVTATRFRLNRLGTYLGRLADYSDERLWASLADATRAWLPSVSPNQ